MKTLAPSSPHPAPPGRDRWLVALIAAIVLFTGVGLRSPWGPDEPRYALVAHEMVEGSSWLLPHRHGLIYGEKPPVGFWAMAAAEKITGSWRWGFLLPGMLAGWLTALLVHDFVSRWRGRRAGLGAAAALLLLSHGVDLTKSAQLDPQVTLWATVGLVLVLRHLWWGPRPWTFLLGCLAMGVGVITKGTAFLPILLVPLWWILRPRQAWRWGADAALTGLGLLTILLPAVCWLAPLAWQAAHGNAEIASYLHGMVVKQTVTRFGAAWHHHEPFWYYLEVILSRWQPWCALAVLWIPTWARRWRRGASDWRLLFAFAATLLIFFSVSPGKRALYIMPLMPVMAILSGAPLAALVRRYWVQRSLRIALRGLGGLLLVASVIQFWIPTPAEVAPWPRIQTGLLFAACGAAILWWGIMTPRRGIALRAVWAGAFLWVISALVSWPSLQPYKAWDSFSAQVAQAVPAAAEIGAISPEEGFDLHYDRPVFWAVPTNEDDDSAEVSAWSELDTWRHAQPQRWVLVRAKVPPAEMTATGLIIEAPRGRKYVLLGPP